MKNIILKGTILIVLTVAAIGIVVGQGLYWESTTIVQIANGKEIHSTSSYRTHMFKQSSENNASIFRLDKEMVYFIDTQKKEYSEMTFAEMEAHTKKANKKLAEMNEKLKNLPPEQRKMMEQMMGKAAMGGQNAKIDVIKTAEKKNISGYICIKYAMKEDTTEIGSVWTTAGVPDFSSMQKDFKEFGQRMAAQMPKAGEMVAAMMKVEGFPVQTTVAGITTTVTKIENKVAAASEFEVPAGYKKVPPKNFKDN
ncbi:MAG: DUF4412 domain-containing protein [Bacteroidota bacterium]